MKCGPDDCPIVAFSDLTHAEQLVERKRIAKKMLDQNFTYQQIAKQLGVSHQTIGRDLAEFVHDGQIKKPAKNAANPKGAGRPKGSKKPHRKPGVKQVQRAVDAAPEEWEQFKKKALEEGYPSAAAKLGELIAEPEVARADLAPSAQQKFDIAVRQHLKKLDQAFEQRVLDEIRNRIDELILPHWKQQIEQSKELFSRRKTLMDKDTFNTIRRALHPDSRQSISDKKLGEAFDTFMSLEKYLLNEKDSPTRFEYNDGANIPNTMAEWDKMKAAASAARRSKRSASSLRPR